METQKQTKLKKVLKKTLKIFLWIIGSIIGLFLLLVVALHIPAVQNFAKNKAVTYLEGKIHTKVEIGRIEIGLPKKIILEDVYFEDQQKDTLLAGKKLAVDISLFELMNNKVELNSINLQGITANISKNKDSVFNFDYIIKAFASQEKKTDSPPMEFSIDKINLDKVNFKFNDATSKNDIAVKINHFDTKIKKFDLNKMDFEVGNANLDGVKLKLTQGLAEAVKKVKDVTVEKAQSQDLKIKLGKINLANINIDYANDNSRLNTKVAFKKLNVSFNAIDLKNQIIDIQTLELSETNGNLALGKLEKIALEEQPIASNSNNWKIKIDKTDISKVNFKFDNDNSVAVKKGIDYQHLDLKNFAVKAENISYNPQTISGTIKSLAVKDKSGVNIQSLKTDFFYGEKGASLKNLYLKTPQTEIKNQIIAGYPSLNAIKENPEQVQINANLQNSKIGFKDLLYFVPDLANTNPFKSNPNAIMNINGKVSGKLSALSIPNLEISGIGTTKLAASGKIIGLPDTKNAYFDLNIRNFQSSSKDVNQFVPKGTIPSNIQLPGQFTVKGSFKGKINNFNTNLNLTSSFGNAKVKATFDQRTKNQENYNAVAELDNFDLGKLIKNDSIGKVSLKANVKGTGLNPKTANAVVDGKISSFDFNKYRYHNLNLNGKINRGLFEVKASSTDKNLTFNLDGSGSFKDKYPKGKLKLNVDIADLEKLNLHAGPLKLRGMIDADVQSADLDFLNGKISANNVIIANEKDQFILDSINVVATSTAEKNTIAVKSQFLNLNVDGKYKLSKIGDAISNSVSRYYDATPGSKKSNPGQQQFAFTVDVKDSPILYKLIPELKSLEPISINGRYNSVNDTIVINGSIPRLIYGANNISGAKIKVQNQENALLYSLVVDNIENNSLQLPFTSISGKAENNVVDYLIQLKDLKDKDRYVIAGTLQTTNLGSEIILDPKQLLLNYENWTIAPDNLIRFGRNGIYANNFELSKEANSIKLQSQSQSANSPLNVDFKDFQIETLTNIAQKSNFKMGGKINGNALIKNLQTSPIFTSDLTIDTFTFQKDTVGNIHVQVNNQVANRYDAKIELTGQENKVNLDGNYRVDTSSLDFVLAIDKLNMKSIQGFTLDNLTNSTGFLSGDLKITGKAANPNVVGDLKFNDVGFKVTQLNSQFKSMNDKIVFSNNSILLNNFTIKDEQDNDLTINGTLDSTDLTNIGFNLSLDADNFKAVNSAAKDNDDYYGELFLDNHLKIKGTLNNPVVEGNIKINKDTKFTIVLPQSDPSIADREGIVEFIDQDQPKLFDDKKVGIDKELSKTKVKGINASVNIEVDKEAEISLIIDKANGDYLKLKGEAQLNGGIDESGKTSLTGRYEFTEGKYQMNFNLIKREFDIKKGSYILWTGEPTTADINITAVYKSETAPIDLVDNQIADLSPEVRNTFKQRIPFETELKMNGELLKPVITFDIVLPEGNNSVSTDIINTTQAKLADLREQPDELNKQVFALLLLNRFIGENPFASESGGTTAAGLARESASKILSQQLNNLAGDLISGVELNFDLQSSEDYTTGQKENKTDLNVGLSKKLLNDRLKVTVGSSFGLEGPQQANQESNNIAGDLALDYQLTKDGRYKVRAYRLNKYQVALQGQVVETGVAFIITIDYNKFRELFHRSEEQKALARKNKEDKEAKKKSKSDE